MSKIRIEHWEYHDGWQWVPDILRNASFNEGKYFDEHGREFREELVGWHCWVYNGGKDFEDWMDQSCPSAECDFRFNGGDPIHTVHITNADQALLFQLKWL